MRIIALKPSTNQLTPGLLNCNSFPILCIKREYHSLAFKGCKSIFLVLYLASSLHIVYVSVKRIICYPQVDSVSLSTFRLCHVQLSCETSSFSAQTHISTCENPNYYSKCISDDKYFLNEVFREIHTLPSVLAALGLRCCARAFSSCSEREILFIAVPVLLIAVASLVAEHGF